MNELRDILVLVAGGAITLLATAVLRQMRDAANAISALVAKVAGHDVSLAEGNRKFRDINEAIAALRAEVGRLDRDGCSRRKDCA